MAWQKPNKTELAPNICALTQRFNVMSSWLADMIVETYGRAAHSAVLEKAVEVLKVNDDVSPIPSPPSGGTDVHDDGAQALFKLNNFNSAMALMSGINNAAVQRLKNLWTGARKEQKEMFHRFELFMGSRDNFKNYRKHLARISESNKKSSQAKTSVIPFFGTYLLIGVLTTMTSVRMS